MLVELHGERKILLLVIPKNSKNCLNGLEHKSSIILDKDVDKDMLGEDAEIEY